MNVLFNIGKRINKFLILVVFFILAQNLLSANDISNKNTNKSNLLIGNSSTLSITFLKDNNKTSTKTYKYDKKTRILIRNSVLFLTLSIVPFGGSAGLFGGLIGYPLADNYNLNRPLISDNYREIPGIVIAAIFGSSLFALGIYFVVMGIINLQKFLKSSKNDEKTTVSMFIKSDISQLANKKKYTMSTGISIKL